MWIHGHVDTRPRACGYMGSDLYLFVSNMIIIIPSKLVLKGTHARDFHSLFLNFFCIFHVLIDEKRSTSNIFEKNLKIRTDIQSFR
jgi:hypothetical protein